MPLTLAHPAAAVPLAKLIGRLGILSALVIGSIAPDLAYFLPFSITRASSHSLAGLFWFCLPAGTLLYALFHSLLWRPLCDLMPAPVQARLLPLVERMSAPWANPPAVPFSVLVGSVTHLIWDSFTHPGAPAVVAIPALRTRIITISEYDVCVFNVLQHLSTALGILLLARWIARWFSRTEPCENPPVFPGWARWAIVAGIVLGAAAIALVVANRYFPARVTLHALQPFAWHAVTTGFASIGAGIILYSAAWHVVRRRRAGFER